MKKVLFLIAVVAAFACVTSYAAAGIQSQLVGNVVNELEDTDYEAAVTGGDIIIAKDDYLVAILSVEDSMSWFTGAFDNLLNSSVTTHAGFDPSAATPAFTGVSLIKVTSVISSTLPDGTFSFAQYVFQGATSADWLTYTGLSGIGDNTAAVLYDDPANNPHIDPATATIASSIATAVNGTRLWELGFAGDTGEFWRATTTSQKADGTADATNILKITGLDFRASLNVLDYNAGIPLVKHNALGDPDISVFASEFLGASQLQLQGNYQPGGTGIWNLKTDTNLYILPVPEPASMLVWAGLAGLFGFMVVRRRQSA